MTEPFGPRERAAAAAGMPTESRQEALDKGIAIAKAQLGAIAQVLSERGVVATLRTTNSSGEAIEPTSLGQDGRVHVVLIPTGHFALSRKIPDSLVHIAVNPIMNNGMISVHKVEAVLKAVIEAEHDAGFPLPEKTVSTDSKRHSPKTATTDTRRESLGNGITQPDSLTDYVTDKLDTDWRQRTQTAA